MFKDVFPRASYLSVVLARVAPQAGPGTIAKAVWAMQVCAKSHKRDAELACNEPRTEEQEKRAERRLANHALAANQYLAECGPTVSTVTLVFGGDPRGACGWMLVEGGPSDGYAIFD